MKNIHWIESQSRALNLVESNYLIIIYDLQQKSYNKSDKGKTGIEIAVGHRALSDKKVYMSGTHISKPDILSCTLALNVICGKSFKDTSKAYH